MKKLIILLSFTLSLISFSNEKTIERILEINFNSSINPATLNYLKSGLKKSDQFDLVLIKMNTPGGLVSTTKKILNLFGESDTPIMVWVTPEGASATSAGAIIASGAHLLAMNEGTNIGAATPITMGGNVKQEDARSKAINDLVALVKSLSQTRGRSSSGFAEMIEKASSFTAQDAYKKKLIDGILNKDSDLKKFIHNKFITMQGTKYRLNVKGISITKYKMDAGQKLLNIFANPAFAYILLLLGAALLYLELQSPGGFIAGSLGAVALLLAGIGMQVLPLNFGALGLIALSFVLFILEVYITSYGILSLAGIGSLIVGSLFLYRTDNAYITLSNNVIISTVSAIVAFLAFTFFVIIRDHKNIGAEKFNNLEGKEGHILSLIEKNNSTFIYQVKIGGEIWKAISNKEYNPGDHISVTSQNNDDMSLNIE